MDYQESRTYIKKAEKYGSVLGLDNMRQLMMRLGNPQDGQKYIHVAGTNGKGSVIAYLYTVLQEAGYRVGRYISPTIYSYRERIECCNQVISREDFAACVTKIAQVIVEMRAEGLPHPTPFEIETAAAFLYFAQKNCDLVLLEVGLGGDMDATNIIGAPEVSVITPISMDHMAFLGNTLGEIAEKKAGIIKTGGITVSAEQEPEVDEVLRRVSREKHTPFILSKASEAVLLSESFEGQSFCFEGEEYYLSLLGRCQKENAMLALTVLAALEQKGFHTTLKQRKTGLLKAKWNGRFTVIHRNPLFLVDGAHNPGAAEKLVDSIKFYLKDKEIYYIMGMFKDKDYNRVIQMTAPYAKKILTIAAPENDRALSAEELAKAVSLYHNDVLPMESPEAAVEKAFSLAKEKDVILAFGSLAFIGVLSEAVQNRKE